MSRALAATDQSISTLHMCKRNQPYIGCPDPGQLGISIQFCWEYPISCCPVGAG